MSTWNSAMWGGAAGQPPGQSISAGTLIYDAYRALGVLRPGQSTSHEGQDDALRLLNDMVDSWNIERLMIWALAIAEYELAAGCGSYTIGPSGTLGGPRPGRVVAATLGSGCLEILTPQEAACGHKPGVYVDNAFPDTKLTIRPAPSGAGTLRLSSWDQFGGFADLQTKYSFPPGYALALRWNLAMELMPYAAIMQKIPNALLASVQERAISSKAAVKSFNSHPPPVMHTDISCGCGGGYDVYTDTY